MSTLNDFEISAGDWRASLKKNAARTRWVMATFILIYLLVGLLIDLFIQTRHYPRVPLEQLIAALVTFRIIPYGTLIVGAIAVVSIWVTFGFHDKIMLLGTEYREITAENTEVPQEKQLYNIVEEMRLAAGLKYLPRIYIIDADYMNAFASGYSEKSAMVAITRGLMQKLDRDELTAVIAHELSHIRHLDIKVTLMASVLTNLTLVIIDILFHAAIFTSNDDREDNRSRNQLLWIIIIVRFLLPLVTLLLMLYLSRTREYMADAGSVELMRNNEPLGRALLKIQGDHQQNRDQHAKAYESTPHEALRREAYIFDPIKQGIKKMSSPSDIFSTHPGILKRLAAIGIKPKNG